MQKEEPYHIICTWKRGLWSCDETTNVGVPLVGGGISGRPDAADSLSVAKVQNH